MKKYLQKCLTWESDGLDTCSAVRVDKVHILERMAGLEILGAIDGLRMFFIVWELKCFFTNLETYLYIIF